MATVDLDISMILKRSSLFVYHIIITGVQQISGTRRRSWVRHVKLMSLPLLLTWPLGERAMGFPACTPQSTLSVLNRIVVFQHFCYYEQCHMHYAGCVSKSICLLQIKVIGKADSSRRPLLFYKGTTVWLLFCVHNSECLTRLARNQEEAHDSANIS